MKFSQYNGILSSDRTVQQISRGVVIIVCFAILSLVFRPSEHLTGRPLSEDGYYSLAVARNMAMGRGITVDGENPTNGFQPLFTLLTVPAWILSGNDRYLALRYVLLLHFIVYALSAYVIGLVTRDSVAVGGAHRKLLRSLTAAVFVTSTFIFFSWFNGLETGLLVLMYAIVWRYYQVRPLDDLRALVRFGLLLGLLVLTRVDASFLVAVVCMGEFWKERTNPRKGVRNALVLGLLAAIVSSPWWLYNLLVFGSFMPTSGSAHYLLTISWDRIGDMISAIIQVAMPLVYLGKSQFESVWVDLFRGVLIIVAALFFFKHRALGGLIPAKDPDIEAHVHRSRRFVGYILTAVAAFAFWYTLFFSAKWFYPRYLAPMTAISVAVLSVGFAVLLQKLPRIALVGLFSLAVPILLALFMVHRSMGGNEFYEVQFPLTKKFVPENESVAALQSGTLGYFRDRVVNLDGKVNREVLGYRHELGAYLRKKSVKWVCEWEQLVPEILGPSYETQGWKKIEKRGNFLLLHYQEDSLTRSRRRGEVVGGMWDG